MVGADEKEKGETNGKKGDCARDLVISVPQANRQGLAGIVIGVGEDTTKFHNVGLDKSTCEIQERQKDIPSKDTSVSGDERKGEDQRKGKEK